MDPPSTMSRKKMSTLSVPSHFFTVRVHCVDHLPCPGVGSDRLTSQVRELLKEDDEETSCTGIVTRRTLTPCVVLRLNPFESSIRTPISCVPGRGTDR